MSTPSKVLIINGPNLNMLGLREPEIYGSQTLDEIEGLCRSTADALGLSCDFRQSNHEGEIVEWIQDAARDTGLKGVLINAAAYTHTSVAIHDALKLLSVPIFELHLSDPKSREDFRHFSYIESLASAVISGKGAAGYTQAIEKLSTL